MTPNNLPNQAKLSPATQKTLDEVSGALWRFTSALRDLSIQELTALAQSARARAVTSLHSDFDLAMAEAAELQCSLTKARLTPLGKWHACLAVIRWDHTKGHGEGIAAYSVSCDGQESAVIAARQLMLEHINELTDNTTLETRLVPEAEWVLEQEDSRFL